MAQVQDIHVRNLAKSTSITGFMVKDTIPPLEVIAVLNEAAVNFVLVGAYAVVGWTRRARATEDVDVVVTTKHHKRAVRAVQTAFPHLELDDQPIVSRFREPGSGNVVIDIIKPYQQLFQAALKNTHEVVSEGHRYKIPSLTMALARKLAAMISPARSDGKRRYDAGDFIFMVQANPEINLDELAALGEHVYPGGGKELVEKVGQIRAGKTILI
jgi:hypothetical protein